MRLRAVYFRPRLASISSAALRYCSFKPPVSTQFEARWHEFERCTARADRAVLVCGSGAGACVAANKFRGIRAATRHDSFSARQCVEDDDVNVLCLGARVIGPNLTVELVGDYVNAMFSGAERHKRRLGENAKFEAEFGATSNTGAARG
jgi:RpiB/LacA/LacB family sugar-phosphate isomerase